MKLKILTAGGTIDKIYFDSKSQYEVGDTTIGEILREANVTIGFECESILKKDSLDMTEDDFRMVFEKVESDPSNRILITHGTDNMINTAKRLLPIKDKVIVFTGSMSPARFRNSDAVFNIGFAACALQTLPPGVYIAMNGRIFDPERSRKNVALNRFEEI